MHELVGINFVVESEVEESKPELQTPRMFRVLLLNDDYTPMDFVIGILKQFFSMPEERAIEIMLEVHKQGKGCCGIYTRDVAETKVQQVNMFSRMNEYPLLCTMEAT